MTKTIKSSTIQNKPCPLAFEDYRDLLTREMKPCTPLFLELLAEDMVKWSDSSDALKLTQFFQSRHIDMANLYSNKDKKNGWLDKNEYLKEAHQYVMSVLGTRREIGALKREYDASMVRTTMPHYDKTWKELEEWRSKLKEPTESGDKIVVIEKFPDVPSVPERKKDE